MCTILIADDDRNVRNDLKSFFLHEGFYVITAENGLTAYNLALVKLPDVIISDVHMPVMDGFKFLSLLKTNPLTSTIPFIFLTSDTEVKETPVVSVINKPFIYTDLLKLVNLKIENLNSSKKINTHTNNNQRQML